MPLDLQRLVGPIQVRGTADDPIYVVSLGAAPITYLKTAAVTNVPAATKTTIITQAYTAGVFEKMTFAVASGDDYAKFFLTINGTDRDTRRTGPDRNLQFDFVGSALDLSPGDIIDVKVEHYHTGDLLNFNSTIYGYF